MSVVEEIKQRIDVVDLISQYVALKRAGRGYVALCPFHTEKTPSFHVDPQRQTWHCFGACSTGGDIFSFVMKKDGCDFAEAKRQLAERAGVALETRRDAQGDARRARLYELNETAAAFFHAALTAETGATARAYLEERRLAPESIERFQIGYAPNSWEALMEHLASRGYGTDEILTAGLGVEGERGPYDRFRHRLMFPIRDDRGRVAGFGGRLLPGEALGSGEHQPKYVNTPQSPIFDKGSILYGLDMAKDAIRSDGRAVIVEGYMDAIAAHEHGFANVVASMGTALTERQVSLLKRHTKSLVLALDEDNAGMEATLRSVYEIVNAHVSSRPVPNARGVVRQETSIDIELRVLTQPTGKDPDEIIRTQPELWGTLVDEAVDVIEYIFAVTERRVDLSTPRGQSAAAASLLPWIAIIGDRVLQSHYLQRLARMAHVDEGTLRLELRRPVPRRLSSNAPAEPQPLRSRDVRDRREEFCLALLFKYPELRAEGLGMEPELFGHSENRALFETWVGWADSGEPFERSLSPDLRPQYERIISLAVPAYDDDSVIRALHDSVQRIEEQRLRTAKRASADVLADLAARDGATIAERALSVWKTGSALEDTAEDEADPAVAFVEDMEAGLKVHQRLLDQRRNTERPAR